MQLICPVHLKKISGSKAVAGFRTESLKNKAVSQSCDCDTAYGGRCPPLFLLAPIFPAVFFKNHMIDPIRHFTLLWKHHPLGRAIQQLPANTLQIVRGGVVMTPPLGSQASVCITTSPVILHKSYAHKEFQAAFIVGQVPA